MRKVAEIELAGRNCTVKLNNLSIANAEKHLGKPITAVLQEGLGMEALHVLLWVGMRTYEPKLKLKDVYELVDEAMDEEAEKYQELMEMIVQLVLGTMGIETDEEPEKKPAAKTKPKASTTTDS